MQQRAYFCCSLNIVKPGFVYSLDKNSRRPTAVIIGGWWTEMSALLSVLDSLSAIEFAFLITGIIQADMVYFKKGE